MTAPVIVLPLVGSGVIASAGRLQDCSRPSSPGAYAWAPCFPMCTAGCRPGGTGAAPPGSWVPSRPRSRGHCSGDLRPDESDRWRYGRLRASAC